MRHHGGGGRADLAGDGDLGHQLVTRQHQGRVVFAHVAEDGGDVIGMAIWFVKFSTWTGRHGIFLEDLFVRPEARGRGVGRALVRELAWLAHSADYARVDWSVLDWNEDALRFYQALGAVALEEWTGYRLTGTALDALSRERPADG